MYERQILFFAAAQGLVASIIVIRARKNHFRAVAARSGHFHQRRGQRHANLRRDSPLRSVICHRLRMIPSGRGDHSAAPLVAREQQNFIQRPPLLVGAGHLQIFELEKNRIVGKPRKSFRAHERRKKDRIANAAPGRLDRLKCDHLKRALRKA